MFNVKFKVKDGRNSLPRSSSRSSQRSASPSSVRTQRSRSADRTKTTKITKNGQTITTIVDGKLRYGNCTHLTDCNQTQTLSYYLLVNIISTWMHQCQQQWIFQTKKKKNQKGWKMFWDFCLSDINGWLNVSSIEDWGLEKDYVHFIAFCANMLSFLSIVNLFDVTENRNESISRFRVYGSAMRSM